MPDLSAPAWPADRLVFLNDVFFCAGDLIRLLQHDDTDMACGMDFIGWKSPPSTNDIQPYGPYGPPLSVGCLPIVFSLTGCELASESCHDAYIISTSLFAPPWRSRWFRTRHAPSCGKAVLVIP